MQAWGNVRKKLSWKWGSLSSLADSKGKTFRIKSALLRPGDIRKNLAESKSKCLRGGEAAMRFQSSLILTESCRAQGTPRHRIAVSSSSSELLQHQATAARSGKRMEISVMMDASPGGGSTAAGLPHGTAPACGRIPGPMAINNAGITNLTRGRAGAWDGGSPGDSALGTSRYTF